MSDLKINKKFAEKYEKYRQKEELQRLKDRYGDQDEENSSGSSDSDSDESEVELDPKLDRDFYRTLSLLKKKDPKIYQKDAKFYTEDTSGLGSDEQPSTSKKSEKPMFLKDYERKIILERGGKYDDDEDDSADEEVSKQMQERAASPTYIQEQKDLQESLRKFVQDSDEEDSDGDGQLLTRRTKTQDEKDKEDADYVEWLKGQAELEGPEEVKDMKYLRDYWNDPQLDEKESFLRDYMLNKRYLEEDEEEEERIPTYNELTQDDMDDSEDEGESFLHKQEDFERQYNFRFEEPDAGKVKTYPRNIATSVRSKDDTRKRKREEVKERKKKEKEQKQQQLKELKNLKRAEIMDKLKHLQELTGNEQLAFNDVDLQGDFDPQQHDQLMQKFFGDEYYGEEEEEKPHFDADDDLEENWNWDTWVGKEENEEEEQNTMEEDNQPNCEDPDFIMDADYDPSQQPVSKKKRKKVREEKKKKTKEDAPLMGKKRKKSLFSEIINKNKPVFDPKEKTFEQYLDEYYKLDFEDIIDDLPCRFRYREVVPNDFGLSTDEVLKADEKELNRWCSLRKTCMYRSERDEHCDVKNFQIKGQNIKKKQQVFVSLYNENAGEEELMESKGKVGKKTRDRPKQAEVTMEKRDLTDETSESLPEQADIKDLKEVTAKDEGEDDEEFLVPKKKMKPEETAVTPKEEVPSKRTGKPKWPNKKTRRPGGRLLSRSMTVTMAGREFSRQRLQAYGLNPKRLYFRELYRQKRKEREKKEKQLKKSKP
ncbi:protein KRI1 homolog [Rhinichthys klamathensis goyatoka]|uniref:protein KRI1 homolog n=1 Tax=Rhinichthys klamathensis goyatoka TaxID=3034132 RepID=UPI0024B62C7F|nr:protein KRI1 homolog [Rhinichthys klamathensis goyatoka]